MRTPDQLEQIAQFDYERRKFQQFPRWEYRLQTALPYDTELNALGKEGWELVAPWKHWFIYKRPLIFKYNYKPEIP